ncbi:hypothetical protein ACOSQ4_032397 [Xanthoceras sorbifolium]
MDQMNKNSKGLQTLETENKDLKIKLNTMVMTTTPPPGFGHVHHEVNNLASAPRQATPATLTSNTRHPIFKRTNCRPSRTLRASSGYHGPRRNRSIHSPKYGSRCPSNCTSSQRAHDT